MATVFITAVPKLGDKSEDVKKLQTRLNEMNAASLTVDGSFGPKTQAAVSAFQKTLGLTGSGVIGPKTLAGLVMAVLAPVKHAEPAWLAIARKELGTKEIIGSSHNPRVIEYHSATTLGAKADEVAWCSSFANWCMKQAGVKGTGSAWARDWLKWGVALDKPRLGCVVIFERNGPGGDSHVAFYLGETDTRVEHLGGNQSNAVTITTSAKTSLLGYRWPKD